MHWAICRFRRRAALAWIVGIGAALSETPALSHGLGERYDLPIPLGLFLAGAAAAVALSFLVVALALPAGARRRGAWLVLDDAPIVRQGLRLAARTVRLLSVAMFCFVIAAGALGAQGTVHNIAPIAVWVIW